MFGILMLVFFPLIQFNHTYLLLIAICRSKFINANYEIRKKNLGG